MNREIKFRGWDTTCISANGKKVDGVMIKVNGIDWKEETVWEDYARGVDLQYVILMQYTGLKDKNNKEIYESDYLGDWCVFWGSGKYILHNISTGDIIDCDERSTKDKEITGNTFETPREHKAMASDF